MLPITKKLSRDFSGAGVGEKLWVVRAGRKRKRDGVGAATAAALRTAGIQTTSPLSARALLSFTSRYPQTWGSAADDRFYNACRQEEGCGIRGRIRAACPAVLCFPLAPRPLDRKGGGLYPDQQLQAT